MQAMKLLQQALAALQVALMVLVVTGAAVGAAMLAWDRANRKHK
jgi:hypothetical protein